MDSKTRVLTAINLEIPDRVPYGFHATPIVQSKLYEYLGIESYRQLMEKLEVDIIDIRGIIDPLWRDPVPKVIDLPEGARRSN